MIFTSKVLDQVFKAVQDEVAEVAVKVFKVEAEATAHQLAAVQQEIDIIRGVYKAAQPQPSALGSAQFSWIEFNRLG